VDGWTTRYTFYVMAVDHPQTRFFAYRGLQIASGWPYRDEAPSFSADGATLAFSRVAEGSEVYVVALSQDLTPKGEAKQLTFRHELSWWPAWTAQRSEIVLLKWSELG
jgi:hypothetical protein